MPTDLIAISEPLPLGISGEDDWASEDALEWEAELDRIGELAVGFDKLAVQLPPELRGLAAQLSEGLTSLLVRPIR